MADFIKKLVVWLIIFLGIDFVWLGLIAKNFYDKHLKNFNRSINVPAAIFTYLLIGIGIIVFVLPLTRNKPLTSTLIFGAIYGLVVYGVYDLTNLATLKDWSSTMVIVDMLWGMFICSSTSVFLRLIFK